MHLDLLAFATPFFISLMPLEYYFSKKKRLQLSNFEETIANLNVGIAERLLEKNISNSIASQRLPIWDKLLCQ